MARYIEETEIYKLLGQAGVARVHCTQIDDLPRANVAPIADTVRKMQERLKEKMNDLPRRNGVFDTYFIVSKPFIDQIAKEMLEGE